MCKMYSVYRNSQKQYNMASLANIENIIKNIILLDYILNVGKADHILVVFLVVANANHVKCSLKADWLKETMFSRQQHHYFYLKFTYRLGHKISAQTGKYCSYLTLALPIFAPHPTLCRSPQNIVLKPVLRYSHPLFCPYMDIIMNPKF